MSVELTSSQGLAGLGTYVYSWPSYNPGDVNVTFSPPTADLGGDTNAQSEATITVSQHTLPSDYVLGLGFDAGSLRVWRMVHTQVTAQTSMSVSLTSNLWFPVGVVTVILLAVAVIVRRLRGVRGRRGGGASAMPI